MDYGFPEIFYLLFLVLLALVKGKFLCNSLASNTVNLFKIQSVDLISDSFAQIGSVS